MNQDKKSRQYLQDLKSCSTDSNDSGISTSLPEEEEDTKEPTGLSSSEDKRKPQCSESEIRKEEISFERKTTDFSSSEFNRKPRRSQSEERKRETLSKEKDKPVNLNGKMNRSFSSPLSSTRDRELPHPQYGISVECSTSHNSKVKVHDGSPPGKKENVLKRYEPKINTITQNAHKTDGEVVILDTAVSLQKVAYNQDRIDNYGQEDSSADLMSLKVTKQISKPLSNGVTIVRTDVGDSAQEFPVSSDTNKTSIGNTFTPPKKNVSPKTTVIEDNASILRNKKSSTHFMSNSSVIVANAIAKIERGLSYNKNENAVTLRGSIPEWKTELMKNKQKKKVNVVENNDQARPTDKVSEGSANTIDELCGPVTPDSSLEKNALTVEPRSRSERPRNDSYCSPRTSKWAVVQNPDDNNRTKNDAYIDKVQIQLPNAPLQSLQQDACILKHQPSLVSLYLNQIAEAIKCNDLIRLKSLVKSFGSDIEMKSSFNILYIAAAVGTVECCQYLLINGFTANASSLHPLVKQVLPEPEKQTKNVSPLALSMCYTNFGIIRLLLMHTSNDILETCSIRSTDIDALVMKDLCRRLFEEYRSLKPRVVAGYEEGTPVLVVYSEALHADTKVFCGKKVKFVNPKMIKREHYMNTEHHNHQSRQISEENMKLAKQVIKERSETLWNYHSNLNIISMSSTKSVGGQLQSVPVCITLHCTSKGFIPLGEQNFPKRLWTLNNLQTIAVDVREGYFTFCPGYATAASLNYHEKLKMGCSISRATNAINGGGTLGPFVDINGEDGFLTCAHVLFDITKGPVDFRDDPPSEIGIVQPANGTFSFNEPESEQFQAASSTPCGYVKKAVFNPHRRVSIDAALVQITNSVRKPISGQFAIENKFGYTHVGFNNPPEYNSGRLKSPKEASVVRQVIKCGSQTHLTRGLLAANGIQVRPLDTLLGLPSLQKKYPMKNQIEVQGVETHAPFLQPGDSGSAVFTVYEDETLECLGMAIGFTSYHTAVVTPINDILEALGPGLTLKAFSN